MRFALACTSATAFCPRGPASAILMTISADQIRQARKLLGWHRGDVAIRARGITGNTVGKAEGAFPGSPPTPEQLQEIRGVLEAAGIEFTIGTPGVKLRRTGVRMPD